jgi:adenine-specific DNA-methyltransferase
MSNNQKVTKHIKFEPNDLEILKQQFPHCFDQCGNFQFEKFKDYLNQNNIPLSSEHYHLNWLGKSYARILATDPTATLLKADTQHHQKDENMKSGNLLIKGDNLDVLKHLVHAYYEKVKMIYIDPPYNTGNDGFIYQDDRKFTVEQLMGMIGGDRGQAERILKFVSGGSNSHSAWLSFMYPRLYLARQLLREDGVIFVSIDDHEVAQLRLLMDEIFGEENFVADLIWRKKAGGANDSNSIATEHEYVLCFVKSFFDVYKKPLEEDTLKKYKFKDSKFKTHGYYYTKNLCDFSLQDSSGLHYDIKCPDQTILKGTQNQWKCSEDTFFKRLDDDRIVFKYINEVWQVHYKIYLNEEKGELKYDENGKIIQKGMNLSSLLKVGLNTESASVIKKLFNFNIFEYSKPISLINELLMIGTKSSDIILDFFAGSGTTAHAVMQLNAEDGGNRKFILVQIPEPIDPKNNKSAYDFVKNDLKSSPTIFEITKERLIRASQQIATTIKEKIQSKESNLTDLESQLTLDDSNQEKINQLKSEIQSLKSQDIHFKIFETVPIWPNYNDEVDQFSNDLKLFDETTLTSEDIQNLLITWKTYDGIPLTQELEEIKLNDYIAHYGNRKLYLIQKDFTIEHLKLLLNRIDDEKDFNPTTIILFAYHFESSILRSISESVKTYNGRKQLQIDVINRY